MTVVIKRDGNTLAQVDSQNAAFEWLLKHQSCSVEHALRYEGYSIEPTEPTAKHVFVPVDSGKMFLCLCVVCGRHLWAGENTKDVVWADLNGDPFKAYYCDDCQRAVSQ